MYEILQTDPIKEKTHDIFEKKSFQTKEEKNIMKMKK